MVNKDILRSCVKEYLSFSYEEINKLFEGLENNKIVVQKLKDDSKPLSEDNYLCSLDLLPLQILGDENKELQVDVCISDGYSELHCDLCFPLDGSPAYSDIT